MSEHLARALLPPTRESACRSGAPDTPALDAVDRALLVVAVLCLAVALPLLCHYLTIGL